MSVWRLMRRSLLHHWRINVAVGLGVAAATAVLLGALLVGDSVRASLRALTLQRLGNIDALLITDRFFRAQLAADLTGAKGFSPGWSRAVPMIVFPRGTMERRQHDRVRRASRVLVVGCDASFWDLATSPPRPEPLPGEGEIVLNQPLAAELRAAVGDQVVLRLPEAGAIPAESPLGEKEDRVRAVPRLKVVSIIPAQGLGRFSLSASQNVSRNAFVALKTLQDPLEQSDQINAIAASRVPGREPPAERDCRQLSGLLAPSLADYGLSITRVRMPFQPDDSAPALTIYDYFTVTSDRMIMDDQTAEAVLAAWADRSPQPVFTYLANALMRLERSAEQTPPDPAEDRGIPYSTVAALDSAAGLGPLLDAAARPIGPLADDEIVLTQWAAEDLGAQPGDTIRLVYFQPETVHGRTTETHADLTLKAVVPLTEPAKPFRRDRPALYAQRPTLANDPHLTPEVRGVTDQETISRWEVPFPLTRKVRSKDEAYYQNHRLTPKAFVSLAVGQRLWRSRFGKVTSVRIAAPADLPVDATAEHIARLEQQLLGQLRRGQAARGFEFRPIKQQGLAASRGATPFDVLFLALSFFIIAAALMLVWLLFRLAIDQRASQIGLLLSTGLGWRRTVRLLLGEASVVAAAGGLLGMVAAAGYASLLLAGLRDGWWGEFVAPPLQFHATPLTLALGYALGMAASLLTIYWSARQLGRLSAVQLLAGRSQPPPDPTRRRSWMGLLVAGISLVMATLLLVAAANLAGESQAGAFVGGGSLVLIALLVLVRRKLHLGGQTHQAGVSSLPSLAARSVGRNPARSISTMSLMACASFLIIALSSFRLEPTPAGTGGFDFIAESSEAVFADLNTRAGREDVLADQAGLLEGSTVLSLRAKPGDDASCNNLYKANQPRVLGVSPAMIAHFDSPRVQSFSWADSAARSEQDRANPWRLLESPLPGGQVPVVIDKTTAMYGLGLLGGVGQQFQYEYDLGVKIRFCVVGLLSGSILQGNLLIGERQFQQYFPDIVGYRFFLIQSPPDKSASVAAVLEDRLGDQGFDASSARQLLESLLAVQNTYLSTFQSLGALGLLLGTFGLATVQLRNVVERRAELALLQAVGFGRSRLAHMVVLENVFLLCGGLGVGVLAALWAVLPHMCFGSASIPFRELGIMLAVVLAVGLLTSLVAVRAILRAPLLPALRGN